MAEPVIRGARWRAGVATAGLAAAGGFVLAAAGAQPNATHLAISAVFSGLMLAFAVCALVAFLRPPRLILTDEALIHVHPYGPPRRIAWGDIDRFVTYDNDSVPSRTTPVVMYKLRPGVKPPGPLAPMYRLCLGLDGALVGAWGREAADLEALLERHRKAATAASGRYWQARHSS